MEVKELIELLQKLPPNLPVIYYEHGTPIHVLHVVMEDQFEIGECVVIN